MDTHKVNWTKTYRLPPSLALMRLNHVLTQSICIGFRGRQGRGDGNVTKGLRLGHHDVHGQVIVGVELAAAVDHARAV